MARGKVYYINNEYREIFTDQNNIVIPTGELIKTKGIDLRIVACISAITNTDTCWEEGNNSRYCSYYKLNNRIEEILKLLDVDKRYFLRELRKIIAQGSNELHEVNRNFDERSILCLQMDYTKGNFITIPYKVLESLAKELSAPAFKLYINLLWLCRDYEKNTFIKKQLVQRKLANLMGYSESTIKPVKKAEEELLKKGLILIESKWESEVGENGIGSKPLHKKYYTILDAF